MGAGNTKRSNYNKSGNAKSNPVEEIYFQWSRTTITVEYYHGENEHHK